MKHYDKTLRAPLWARGGHSQTLLGHVLPSPGEKIGSAYGHASSSIELDDGDQLVAFVLPPIGPPNNVRVHLFHGLSGDVNSEYMRRTAEVLRAKGCEVWAVNHRGCGEGLGLAKGLYHSGKVEDMQAVLTASRNAPGGADRRHVVLGFSLSANIALLLAAKKLEPAPDGVLAVNPPMDLARAAHDIHLGGNRIYELRFLRRLCRAMEQRFLAGQLERRMPITKTMSLAAFDDVVTAPLGGFTSGADYYERCSTHLRLRDIELPTVIITTRDDPFVSGRALDSLAHSPSVHLHLENTGGHVGYLSRGAYPFSFTRWLDGAVMHYLEELVREIEN